MFQPFDTINEFLFYYLSNITYFTIGIAVRITVIFIQITLIVFQVALVIAIIYFIILGIVKLGSRIRGIITPYVNS